MELPRIFIRRQLCIVLFALAYIGVFKQIDLINENLLLLCVIVLFFIWEDIVGMLVIFQFQIQVSDNIDCFVEFHVKLNDCLVFQPDGLFVSGQFCSLHFILLNQHRNIVCWHLPTVLRVNGFYLALQIADFMVKIVDFIVLLFVNDSQRVYLLRLLLDLRLLQLWTQLYFLQSRLHLNLLHFMVSDYHLLIV